MKGTLFIFIIYCEPVFWQDPNSLQVGWDPNHFFFDFFWGGISKDFWSIYARQNRGNHPIWPEDFSRWVAQTNRQLSTFGKSLFHFFLLASHWLCLVGRPLGKDWVGGIRNCMKCSVFSMLSMVSIWVYKGRTSEHISHINGPGRYLET